MVDTVKGLCLVAAATVCSLGFTADKVKARAAPSSPEGVKLTQCYSACGVAGEAAHWFKEVLGPKKPFVLSVCFRDLHSPIATNPRFGDWKIVGDDTLSKFQLYEVQKDWQEQNDLASEMPEKIEEMKRILLELWADIEAEGPREWREGVRQPLEKGGTLAY